MNKELIKKYKAEFDHWINGGKVISKYTLIPTWSNCQSEDIWRIPDKNISKVLIVINDEYATYRKALAEGKIVEVATDYNDVDGYIWKSMEDKEFHYFNINEIRIKPEEPKFKVGDWVRCYDLGKELIVQITGEYYPKDDAYLCSNGPRNTKFLEHWQPKLGEWCIMYDTDENPNASSVTLQKWDGKNKWKPIPFIGQLPPYIKASNGS